MAADKVVVVGAGMGGLACALDLARRGVDVTVVDKASAPGGKMRLVNGMDAGPTVFTMRWAFDGLFEDAGESLESHLTLEPLEVLARHAWRAGGRLDLFADVERSAEAIAAFSGPRDAKGYRNFAARSAEIYQTLAAHFIAAERPSPTELVSRVGLRNLDALWRTLPFTALAEALEDFFEDPRLRQLFGRYSTYVGSSPFLAPATLMLVSHVERQGLFKVKGGMHQVALTLQRLAEARGARFLLGTAVKEVLVEGGRARGVLLANGERLPCDAVAFNGDVSALAAGLLGPGPTGAVRATPPRARSLSAVTWCLTARTSGFPLAHHNVFFAEDYEAEFDAIFKRRDVTQAPTVYLCAQDRGVGPSPTVDGPERMLVLINAPADGDTRVLDEAALQALRRRAWDVLGRCGLSLDDSAPISEVATGPSGFEQLFPASGGALYGRANHGFLGTFERQGNVTSLPGLYMVGGSVHPGPGVPMAVLSGRLCAARMAEDRFGRQPGRGVVTVRPG